ncbi:hypothetical protein T01_15946, partial [Trichinella spiralis]
LSAWRIVAIATALCRTLRLWQQRCCLVGIDIRICVFAVIVGVFFFVVLFGQRGPFRIIIQRSVDSVLDARLACRDSRLEIFGRQLFRSAQSPVSVEWYQRGRRRGFRLTSARADHEHGQADGAGRHDHQKHTERQGDVFGWNDIVGENCDRRRGTFCRRR